MGRRRSRWSASEKWKIIQECQQSGASVAEVCRRHGINTGLYYRWVKQVEEAALEALNGKHRDRPSNRELRLKKEVERLKEVVVEITAENLDLKKTFGD